MAKLGWTALFALGVSTTPAQAQNRQPQSELIDALARCAAETDNARRLACYDPAVKALTDASSKGQVTIVSRDDVRKTRRSLFGFNLPSLPFFGGDRSADEMPDTIELSIKTARSTSSGTYIFGFEDGSVWRTTDPVVNLPRIGEKVTIKKGVLGNYFLRVAGRSVRGLRVK